MAIFCVKIKQYSISLNENLVQAQICFSSFFCYRFMYTLEADIKSESVMAVLYAAKKYDIQPLVARCRTFLKEGLDKENVSEILERAVTFTEQKLVDECIAFIKENAAEVVNADGLLGVSQPVLRIVFEKGFVEIDPLICYEITKKWALKHFKADKLEDIDLEKVRNVLGNVLNGIRFSDMQLDTFIENVVSEDIVTDSTKLSIILAINKKQKSMEAIHVHRFTEIAQGYWNHVGFQSGISLTVSSPALLTGVCLYLPKDKGETSGPLEILEENKAVHKQIVKLKYQNGMKYRNEPLSTKIPLQQDKVYSVRHSFKGPVTYFGEGPITKSYDHHHDTTIEFMNLKHGNSDGTNLKSGQIKGLAVQVTNK